MDLDAETRAEREARHGLARSIGHFSIAFAMAEQQLNGAICVFLKLPNSSVGMLLTGAIRNVSTRLDIFSSLAHGLKMKPVLRSQFIECAAAFRELNTYRNWLLHDAWGIWNPQANAWPKMKTKTEQKFRRQFKQFSTGEIDAKLGECQQLVSKLSKAIYEYSA